MLPNKSLTVIANWKMHPEHLSIAQDLCNFYITEIMLNHINLINKLELIVAPPAIYLAKLKELVAKARVDLAFSAQNIAANEVVGAFTGQLSARMFKNIGCQYTLVGHSECRRDFDLTNEVLAIQLSAAIKADLIPVFCIGEPKVLFDQGLKQVEQFLANQIKPILEVLKNLNFNTKLLIAYEPIWAIGNNIIPDLEYIQQIINYVYKLIYANTELTKQQVKFLYGGSVNLSNIKDLVALPEIDGVLVGAAALDQQQFLAMWRVLIEN